MTLKTKSFYFVDDHINSDGKLVMKLGEAIAINDKNVILVPQFVSGICQILSGADKHDIVVSFVGEDIADYRYCAGASMSYQQIEHCDDLWIEVEHYIMDYINQTTNKLKELKACFV